MMVRYILCCDENHKFEAWFHCEFEAKRQIEHDTLVCPLCELATIGNMSLGTDEQSVLDEAWSIKLQAPALH